MRTDEVDPWSHFVNVLMLDRNGNRINRRNPQDIFTPLYDHQIPPGAGQVVHYRLAVPKDVTGPVELTVRLRYRKFDYEVHGTRPQGRGQTDAEAADRRHLRGPASPCRSRESPQTVPAQESPIKPAWQRWNDYGIGCYLEGGAGNKKGDMRQAEAAFKKMLTLDAKDAQSHAHINLARVYYDLGQLDKASTELNAAKSCDPPAPWWLVDWFSGLVIAQNATFGKTQDDLDKAIERFEHIVDPNSQPKRENGTLKYDFTRNVVVLAELGRTLFKRSLLEHADPTAEREFVMRAIASYERALAVDPEDVDSHFGLSQCYRTLSRNVEPLPPPSQPPEPKQLEEMASKAFAKDKPIAERIEVATTLASTLSAFHNRLPDPKNPILPTIRLLLTRFRTAYRDETNPRMKEAVAAVLSQLHLMSQAIYKPDDLARSIERAFRDRHPAADKAAEAKVFYPTNRQDAPGLGK